MTSVTGEEAALVLIINKGEGGFVTLARNWCSNLSSKKYKWNMLSVHQTELKTWMMSHTNRSSSIRKLVRQGNGGPFYTKANLIAKRSKTVAFLIHFQRETFAKTGSSWLTHQKDDTVPNVSKITFCRKLNNKRVERLGILYMRRRQNTRQNTWLSWETDMVWSRVREGRRGHHQ